MLLQVLLLILETLPLAGLWLAAVEGVDPALIVAGVATILWWWKKLAGIIPVTVRVADRRILTTLQTALDAPAIQRVAAAELGRRLTEQEREAVLALCLPWWHRL